MNDELSRQYERRCPRCGEALVVRRNRASGEEFWGCGQWPECQYTEALPEYVRLRRQGIEPLPGFD